MSSSDNTMDHNTSHNNMDDKKNDDKKFKLFIGKDSDDNKIFIEENGLYQNFLVEIE